MIFIKINLRKAEMTKLTEYEKKTLKDINIWKMPKEKTFYKRVFL